MRPKLTAALPIAVLLALVAAPAALAEPTANFTFRHGEANYRTSPLTLPGAYTPPAPRAPCPSTGIPCTWEAHEFEIAPGEANGSMSVTITWADAANDWDLYVYKVRTDGTIDESRPVASSASFGENFETATLDQADEPISPGTYRIYVDNWVQEGEPDSHWEGFVAFSPWIAPNVRPTASISAPHRAAPGEAITLDASGSNDPDGRIVSYWWDLDGDGRFETDGGDSPTRAASFPAGARHVGLRVTDDDGALGYALHSIDVAAPDAGPSQTVLPPPAGRVALDVPRRQSLSVVARLGLKATVECPTACRIRASLRITRRTARALGLGRRARTIATARRTMRTRGFPRLRLRPSMRTVRALRSQRRVRTILRVVVDAEGHARRRFRAPVAVVRR